MSRFTQLRLFYFAITILSFAVIPIQSEAANKDRGNEEKERLVLMPLRVPTEDITLTGAMETALVNGLQQKYDVYSGEQVSQKAHQIFLKESRNPSRTECDETKCMQKIAEAFQAELIATASVTKQNGVYFLAMSIQNIFDNKVVYSESRPCEGCNAAQVVEKLKNLSSVTMSTSYQIPANSSVSGTRASIATGKNEIIIKPGTAFRDCENCPEMVVIPAGNFIMGSNSGYKDEKPIHRVTIKKAFAIGKTEITQLQWIAIMGNSPSEYNFGDNHAVQNISWNDVKIFIEKLNLKTGKQYRLPSESEWEYSCRAGAHEEFCGSDVLERVASTGGFLNPVASRQANAFGLYDMTGGVWEWVEDNYHSSYKGAPTDGSVWKGDDLRHVLRGGEWGNGNQPYAALRYSNGIDGKSQDIGFRLARTLP